MTERVIRITDGRRMKPLPSEGTLGSPGRSGEYALGRRLRDLLISDYEFLPKSELMSFEEIARLTRVFCGHGVEKVRLTGGEPLLRKNLERLIEMLADIPGLDLTLTTNGSV